MEANGGPKGKGWTGSQAALKQSVRPSGRGTGRAGLTPGLGAHPPTTSPPLSAESLCPRRWPSGQCSGPGDMEGSSGLGPSPTTPTDGAADHPETLRAGGPPCSLPRRCGLLPSQPYCHPGGWGEGGRAVLAYSSPIHGWARTGRAREIGLGSGVRGQGTGGEVLSVRTTEGVKE